MVPVYVNFPLNCCHPCANTVITVLTRPGSHFKLCYFTALTSAVFHCTLQIWFFTAFLLIYSAQQSGTLAPLYNIRLDSSHSSCCLVFAVLLSVCIYGYLFLFSLTTWIFRLSCMIKPYVFKIKNTTNRTEQGCVYGDVLKQILWSEILQLKHILMLNLFVVTPLGSSVKVT